MEVKTIGLDAVELACPQDYGLGPGIDATTTAAGGCGRAGEQDCVDCLRLDGAQHALQSCSHRLAGTAGLGLARAKEHNGKVVCIDVLGYGTQENFGRRLTHRGSILIGSWSRWLTQRGSLSLLEVFF